MFLNLYITIISFKGGERFKDLCLAFHRFSIENLRDLSKNALTLSVFELERCSFF